MPTIEQKAGLDSDRLFALVRLMLLTTLPALSDTLTDYGLNAGQLFMALEAYSESMDQFIKLNHDQFERPLEYLEIKDIQSTVEAFRKLLPLIVVDPDDVITLYNSEEDEDDD